jgi:hypothetical protein
MEIDTEKKDEAVLALLYLTLHDGSRAWKSFDWDAMNRLHEKGFISNPVTSRVPHAARGTCVDEQVDDHAGVCPPGFTRPNSHT